MLLMPPSLTEWLPENHLVWTVLGAVDQMDLDRAREAYRLGAAGRAPYDPQMLVALLLYAPPDATPSCATNSTMASVGVRELRQRASELLRRVEEGESIEITDRGRPVAVLAPLPADPIGRLIAAGDLQPSDGDITELPEPLLVSAATELPSATLARLRHDER